MTQNRSWEANRFSASQEILRISWNPKAHYHIHTCPSPVPILTHINPVHTSKSHSLKINLIIILPFMPGSSKWSLSFRIPHQNPVYNSTHPQTCYMPRLPHTTRFYHPNNIGWGVKITQLLIIWFSPLPCYLVPLRSKYSPQYSILRHPQPTFLPIVSDKVSHP